MVDKISGGGVTLELNNFMDRINDAAVKAVDKAAEEMKKELEVLIEDLDENSSNRLTHAQSQNRSVSSGTRDNPLKGAVVKIDRPSTLSFLRRSKHRVRVYVEHDDGNGNNLFEILDKGAPSRTVKNISFPAYDGHNTSRHSLRAGSVHLKRIIFLRNRRIKGFKGRGFYSEAWERVKELYNRVEIDTFWGKKTVRISDVVQFREVD